MGRAKHFNENLVTKKALLVFIKKGYEATSLKDLEKATGLKPGSFYHSFGNKQSMFLRVINYYIEEVVIARINTYLSSEQPIQGIKSLFTSTFESPARARCGCLLVNTAVEVGIGNAKIHKRIMYGFHLFEEAFTKQIEKARQLGLLKTKQKTSSLVKQLLLSYQGILVMVKITRDKQTLKKVTDDALSII